MDTDTDPAAAAAAPPAATPIAHLDVKARLLLVGVALLVAAAIAYVLYARGVFERTQTLVLMAENSEGTVVGMDLTFAGFPIGRVARIELAEGGNARVVVDVPKQDAHWLRTSSVFTMESGLVGATRLRAFSGVPSDPPLPDGAVRQVLAGDAAAEIPRLMSAVRDLIANLTAMTGPDAPINAGLRGVQSTTERLAGKRGALGLLLGDDREADKIIVTLDRTNALLLRLDGLVAQVTRLTGRVDGMAAKTDAQVFGGAQAIGSAADATAAATADAPADSTASATDGGRPGAAGGGGGGGAYRAGPNGGGLLGDARAGVVQLNGLLTDARGSLKKVDALLEQAQGIAANTREASVDLGALRGEVEASLRKVEQLVNEVNRKWPFKRDAEVKLP